MADEVQFTDEQWEAVAAAAETFARVLETERNRLSWTLQSNWAGQCAEGEATMANLQALVHGEDGSFSQAIFAESGYLRSVAAQCKASRAALTSADEDEAEQFRQ